MFLITHIAGKYQIELTPSELGMAIVSLRQISLGGSARILPQDFQSRMGVTEAYASAVEAKLSEFELATQSHGVEGDLALLELRENLYKIQLSRQNLMVITRAINELANGILIPEWEFQTITGYYRSELRQLMHQLHQLLVHGGRDLKQLDIYRQKKKTESE